MVSLGVWVTAVLLSSPGLFWVFQTIFYNAVVWMISILSLICNFSSLFLFKPLLSYSTAYSAHWQNPNICTSISLCSAWTAKSTWWQVLFFFFLLLNNCRSGLLAGIRWSVCISKSHSLRRILVCSFIIWYYRQILIDTFHIGSFSYANVICTLFVQVSYIHIIFVLLLWQFLTLALIDVFFYWSLSDSKFLHVSRTLLNILTNL